MRVALWEIKGALAVSQETNFGKYLDDTDTV